MKRVECLYVSNYNIEMEADLKSTDNVLASYFDNTQLKLKYLNQKQNTISSFFLSKS